MIAVVAGLLGAGVATLALAAAASATLVKGMPIVIKTTGDGDHERSFALRYWPRGSAPVSHRGSAVRTIASRRIDRLPGGDARQQLAGTEVLEGAQGTLTLVWSGTQTRASTACWGRAIGTWRLVAGTGAYAGRSGRGTFASDATLTAVEYRGLLITAL